jgi:hypothetical protein
MTKQKRKMDESGEEIKEEEDNGKKMKMEVKEEEELAEEKMDEVKEEEVDQGNNTTIPLVIIF